MINTLIVLVAKYLFGVSILVAGYVWFCAKPEDKRRMLILSLITLPLSFVIARILNRVIDDPRPFVVLNVQPLIAHSSDNGFPSDHTLISMTFAAIVYVINKKWGIVLTFVALLVGISRVMALVHHPLDIFGSVVIAVVATWAGLYFTRRLLVK